MPREDEGSVAVGAKVVVFFGMIATGKSFLAAAWADRHGCAYYNSDRVRKELAGLAPESRQALAVEQGIYSAAFSRRTYDHLLHLAEQEVLMHKQGCVVLDGSYQARSERTRVREQLATGARVLFVHCICPEKVMRQRMEQRQRDPMAVSDGRWEIYLQQKMRFEDPDELNASRLLTLNTNQDLELLLAELDAWMSQKEAEGEMES